MEPLRPSVVVPRRRRVLLAAGLALLGAAPVVAVALTHVPAAPAPVVVVRAAAPAITVAPPQVTVTVPTPASTPSLLVDEPAPAPVRATTPRLAADCIVGYEEDAPGPPHCTWDEGFPAISADGKTVATRFVPDDGNRGNPAASIHFIDVASGKLVEDLVVLSPDEWDTIERSKLRAQMHTRARAAQRKLDAGGYRAMTALGSNDMYSEHIEVDTKAVHAEFADSTVRIIDPVARRAIGTHTFGVAPARAPDPDDDCSGWGMRELSVWWDETTRVVLGSMTYETGGCMCGMAQVEQVTRLR